MTLPENRFDRIVEACARIFVAGLIVTAIVIAHELTIENSWVPVMLGIILATSLKIGIICTLFSMSYDSGRGQGRKDTTEKDEGEESNDS